MLYKQHSGFCKLFRIAYREMRLQMIWFPLRNQMILTELRKMHRRHVRTCTFSITPLFCLKLLPTAHAYFELQFFSRVKKDMIDSPVGRECKGAVSRHRWHAVQHIIALSCGKIGTGRHAAVNPFFSCRTPLFCV